MRIADTSCLYAAFIVEDAHHAPAQAELAEPEHLLIPTEILCETIALLQRRKGFDVAFAAGEGLRALPHVRIEGAPAAVVARAWREFAKAAGKLSVPDAFVVAWCAERSATPMTFDREIVRRARAR